MSAFLLLPFSSGATAVGRGRSTRRDANDEKGIGACVIAHAARIVGAQMLPASKRCSSFSSSSLIIVFILVERKIDDFFFPGMHITP